MKKWDWSYSFGQAFVVKLSPQKRYDPVTKENIMKTKATKKTKTVAKGNGIICGNLDNIQEASRELDHTMKVVWTSVGFWACPKA